MRRRLCRCRAPLKSDGTCQFGCLSPADLRELKRQRRETRMKLKREGVNERHIGFGTQHERTRLTEKVRALGPGYTAAPEYSERGARRK